MSDILCIDTETTGLGKYGDFDGVWLCELGLVWSDGRDQSTLVRLPDGVDLHPKAAEVNGLSRDICEAGVSQEEAVLLISTALETSDVVVGHNIVYFDLSLLINISHRFGAELYSSLIIDTKLIWIAERLGLKREPNEPVLSFYGRVKEASKHYKRPSSLEVIYTYMTEKAARQTHRAAGDCRLTLELFAKMQKSGWISDVLRLEVVA